MKKNVLYPGSFDPITKGHMNIIEQASDLFDWVVVAVMNNPNKSNYLFTIEERYNMIYELYGGKKNIIPVWGEEKQTAVDLALEEDCVGIIRGLRSMSDFGYEFQMQQFNKDLSDNQINTVCLFADKDYQFISSSAVKELFYLGKDISKYVDPYVEEQMKLKLRR